MRVFQINTVLNGSTGKIARAIYEFAKENGIESRIAYSRGPVFDNSDFIKFGSKFGVCLHGALARIFDTSGLHSSFATNKLIREIDKFGPDIVHLHNLHGYYLNYKILLKYIAKKNIKTILTLHDCWCFTGHCAYFDMANCNKWKIGCRDCPNKKAYPRSFIFDRSRKNYNLKKKLFSCLNDLTIVTPSNWLAELVKQSFFANTSVKVIHNGINLDVFKPTSSDFREKYNLADKKILLGAAGVWDLRKGLNDFIQLRKMLNEEYSIVLVGLTEKQIASLPKGIIGIPRTESAEELAGIYTTADIFVNPTKEEVLGMVNLEAIACGTPVITYNTGGSPECLVCGGDETNGRVVEKGNIEALKTAILTLSAADTNFNNDTFSQKAFLQSYCEIYKKCF